MYIGDIVRVQCMYVCACICAKYILYAYKLRTYIMYVYYILIDYTSIENTYVHTVYIINCLYISLMYVRTYVTVCVTLDFCVLSRLLLRTRRAPPRLKPRPLCWPPNCHCPPAIKKAQGLALLLWLWREFP